MPPKKKSNRGRKKKTETPKPVNQKKPKVVAEKPKDKTSKKGKNPKPKVDKKKKLVNTKPKAATPQDVQLAIDKLSTEIIDKKTKYDVAVESYFNKNKDINLIEYKADILKGIIRNLADSKAKIVKKSTQPQVHIVDKKSNKKKPVSDVFSKAIERAKEKIAFFVNTNVEWGERAFMVPIPDESMDEQLISELGKEGMAVIKEKEVVDYGKRYVKFHQKDTRKRVLPEIVYKGQTKMVETEYGQQYQILNDEIVAECPEGMSLGAVGDEEKTAACFFSDDAVNKALRETQK